MTAQSGVIRLGWLTLTTPAIIDWFAVNQFTVTENRTTRRPDIVLFLNGLPLGVIELKNPHRRGRHHLDCVAAAPDLPGGTPLPVRDERVADSLRRPGRPRRPSHRRA